MDAFAGMWARAALFEPASAPEPSEAGVAVLWLQHRCGLFSDIRVPGSGAPACGVAALPKAFAGYCAKDGAVLTWSRWLDFRLPGTPDVGRVSFQAGPHATGESALSCSADAAATSDWLREDSVLPGDDFYELWQRLEGAQSTEHGADFALLLALGSATGAGPEPVHLTAHPPPVFATALRTAVVLRVGSFWSFQISRPASLGAACTASSAPPTRCVLAYHAASGRVCSCEAGDHDRWECAAVLPGDRALFSTKEGDAREGIETLLKLCADEARATNPSASWSICVTDGVVPPWLGEAAAAKPG